jgi:outer membrane lipoprotein LolB
VTPKRATLRTLAVMWAGLALGGCVTLGDGPQTRPYSATDTDDRYVLWRDQRGGLMAMAHFTLEGRVAASGQPGAARLHWQQLATDRFSGRVSGPFGVGAVHLEGTVNRVRVRHRDEDFVSDDPEADLQALLGWALPLAALPYWARGLPQPGQPARFAIDDLGRLRALTQGGWQIDYAAYDSGHEAPALPQRIQLTRGDQVLTLIADRWHLPDHP